MNKMISLPNGRFFCEEMIEAEQISNKIVTEALKWVGYPSVRYSGSENGLSPVDGFDCSGFARFVLERSGLPISKDTRHCNEFMDRFGVLVQKSRHS